MYYTASGIITPIGGRPVHRLREDWSALNLFTDLFVYLCFIFVPGSSVGIATRYGLGGPGSNPGGGEIFRTCPDRSWCPHSLLYNGYRVFPGGKAAGAGR